MYLVAIAELNGTIESCDLMALAADLETTAYELRLLLNAGFPAVVKVTADPAQARAVAAAIARHRHVPILCDRDKTVASAQMTTLRHFDLTPTALVAEHGAPDACPFDDIAVMLRATHRTTRETVEQVKERQLQPVMAIATGGLILSKKVTKDVTTTTTNREQVLYIFRRGMNAPWILRERVASYVTLGTAMGPSSFENFTKTITELRKRAPQAAYDERLVAGRTIRGVSDGSDATDLLAYILAEYLVRRPV